MTVQDRIGVARARLSGVLAGATEQARISVYGPYGRQQEAVAAGALSVLMLHTDQVGGLCVWCGLPWPCPDLAAVLAAHSA